MALSCGIIGLPMVGKTTLFNLLTQAGVETSNFFSGKTATNIACAYVPDQRLDWLTELFHPKKTTYAQLEVIDVPGLVRGASQGQGTGNEFLTGVRDAQALIHIVRAFENPDILHVDGSCSIMRDVETVDMELLFADLQLVETRLSRINSGKKKKMENPLEESVLLKCQAALEEETPISKLEFSEEEREAIQHITFLTDKPMLFAVNVDEDQLASGDFPEKAEFMAYCANRGVQPLIVCARLEEEICQLPPDERQVFLEDLGLREPGIDRMAKALYDGLGLISFLTAGDDEVRAWTIPAGLPAKQAAGKIHSDIERGFIRAETVAFDDLKSCGSMAAARDKGCFRLEGKEYVVQDGDIINFRFNV